MRFDSRHHSKGKPRSGRQSRAWASSVQAVSGVCAIGRKISLLGTRRTDLAVVVIVALVAIGLDVRVDRIRDPLIGACEEDGASGNRPGSAAWQVLMWGCAERTTTGAGDLRKRTARLQTEGTA